MKKILVAENNPTQLLELVACLEKSNEFVVSQATDGISAYHKSKAQKFDAICIAFRLPTLNFGVSSEFPRRPIL